jgi:hypothetical protein
VQHGLHAAVPAVAYPAGDAEFFRLPVQGFAEEDALDDAVYLEVFGDFH